MCFPGQSSRHKLSCLPSTGTHCTHRQGSTTSSTVSESMYNSSCWQRALGMTHDDAAVKDPAAAFDQVRTRTTAKHECVRDHVTTARTVLCATERSSALPTSGSDRARRPPIVWLATANVMPQESQRSTAPSLPGRRAYSVSTSTTKPLYQALGESSPMFIATNSRPS